MLRTEELASLRVLVDELGWWRTATVAAKIKWAQVRGEPFVDLPPPETEAERMSRQQVGPAVLLYRALSARFDGERALAITERAVVEAGVAFLARTVGRLDRDRLDQMDDDEREDFVRRSGDQFFNAELEWEAIAADRVEFSVTHCRFPALCEAADVPELAPMFCKADAAFFGGVEEEVDLHRPHTIAEGARTCPFRIEMCEEGAGEPDGEAPPGS